MSEPVRLLGDPVLYKPCVELPPESISEEYIQPILDTMKETMEAENGIGLAANQIGRSLRIFILKNDDGSVTEYINPLILVATEFVDFEGEACLSVPGASAITRRYKNLTLRWVDKNGLSHEADFKDRAAFAVQHEIDHLNGKLYLDQFGPVKKQLLTKKHKKYMRLLRR